VNYIQKILLLLLFFCYFNVCAQPDEHFVPNKESTVISPLTSAEIASLKRKIFKVAVTEYPPFVYFNDIPKNSNQFDGVSFEALKIIGKKLGIQFEFIKCTDLNEALNMVLENRADLVIKMNEPNTLLRHSIPYFEKKAKIVILRGKTLSWTDIITPVKDKKITMVEIRGTDMISMVKTNIIPALIQVDTPIESLAKIAFGEADFALMDLSQFGYYRRKLDSTRLVIIGDNQIFNIHTVFGFSPQTDENFISAIDKAISSFTNQEFQRLNNHWETFAWEEPLVRPEFAILLFCIAFSFMNNVIWYIFYMKSMALSERENNKRWLAAVTETIKNERAAQALKNKQN